MENYHHELPIRSKIDVAQEIGQIIHCLFSWPGIEGE